METEAVFLVVLETRWGRARDEFHNDFTYTSCLARSQLVSNLTKSTASDYFKRLRFYRHDFVHLLLFKGLGLDF
jgi:hypothetical protein